MKSTVVGHPGGITETDMLARAHPVIIVRPNGEIVYENAVARYLLGHSEEGGDLILSSLLTSGTWDDILSKVAETGGLRDEPILLKTIFGDTDLSYVTMLPQLNDGGEIEEIICGWSARKDAVTVPVPTADVGELSRYVHDLEKLIEHRTYQQVLAAEQTEFLAEVVDLLPEGLLVVSPDGDVLYRNRAMWEDFGVRTSDYGRPNIRYFFPRDALDIFRHVAGTGLRNSCMVNDPGGLRAVIQFLPILRATTVRQIVIHFSRMAAAEDDQ